MTTAQAFADYLGMTEENAGWAFGPRVCPHCGHGGVDHRPSVCFKCRAPFVFAEWLAPVTATSPLAPDPTPGWLEALVRHKHGVLYWGEMACQAAFMDGGVLSTEKHPTHAVARALIAADPALRARLEACEDWEG